MEDLLLLIAEIQESQVVLDKLHRLYNTYEPSFRNLEQRDLRDAVLLSDILCNTYTCCETIFLRISRLFENHLEESQWHKELLKKMRVEIPGLRKALLTHESYQLLDELRRFRHFKRYYYDFDYDWLRLDYLSAVYNQLVPLLDCQLADYINFLRDLHSQSPHPV
ncbi:MAG: hypothetical protein VKK80_04715 [Prochlorothrix sp.]|nr:hypothetical protein [Prochlorothrix sp.]